MEKPVSDKLNAEFQDAMNSICEKSLKPLVDIKTLRRFRFRGTHCLLTYKHHVDKIDMEEFLSKFGKIKNCYIAHEVGTSKKKKDGSPEDINCPLLYNHSHIYVEWKIKVDIDGPREFDFKGIDYVKGFKDPNWDNFNTTKTHPHFRKICPGRMHLLRVLLYISKEDPSLKWLKTNCEEEMESPAMKIWACKSLEDALKKCVRISDASGIQLLWDLKPKIEEEALDPTIYLHYTWQEDLWGSLLSNKWRQRDILWLFEIVGLVGKSKFVECFRSNFPKDVLSVTGFRGDGNAANFIMQGIEAGWTGKFLFLDLPRDSEEHINYYSALECICTGMMTNTKYKCKPVLIPGGACRVIVTSNFLPNVEAEHVSKDRFWIHEIISDPNTKGDYILENHYNMYRTAAIKKDKEARALPRKCFAVPEKKLKKEKEEGAPP